MWKPQSWGFWKGPAVKKPGAVVLRVLQSEYFSIHPPGHLQAMRTNHPISSALLQPFSWVQPGKWLLITWIFQAVARGYFVSLAFWAAPQGDRCSCGNHPGEITADSFRSLEMMVSRSSTRFTPRVPPSLSLGLRDVPWTEVYKEQMQNKSLVEIFCCWVTSSQALLWSKGTTEHRFYASWSAVLDMCNTFWWIVESSSHIKGVFKTWSAPCRESTTQAETQQL